MNSPPAGFRAFHLLSVSNRSPISSANWDPHTRSPLDSCCNGGESFASSLSHSNLNLNIVLQRVGFTNRLGDVNLKASWTVCPLDMPKTPSSTPAQHVQMLTSACRLSGTCGIIAKHTWAESQHSSRPNIHTISHPPLLLGCQAN